MPFLTAPVQINESLASPIYATLLSTKTLLLDEECAIVISDSTPSRWRDNNASQSLTDEFASLVPVFSRLLRMTVEPHDGLAQITRLENRAVKIGKL